MMTDEVVKLESENSIFKNFEGGVAPDTFSFWLGSGYGLAIDIIRHETLI